jgi:hypothetical protein
MESSLHRKGRDSIECSYNKQPYDTRSFEEESLCSLPGRGPSDNAVAHPDAITIASDNGTTVCLNANCHCQQGGRHHDDPRI